MTIKIIGAGFGRTGTSSLQVALEELGVGRCYHMREVFTHPEHAPTWSAAMQGHAVDWDRLLAGYQATVDWPGCTFYRQLMRRYPEANVLLTVRDPEQWYTSCRNTIYAIRANRMLRLLLRLNPRLRRVTEMGNRIIWDGTFHDRFLDKPYAIAVYTQHIAEVQRVVPAERLLVYEVTEGWEPLCRFLEVPVPADKPFPRLNDTAQFQRMIRQRTRIAQAAASGGIAAVALGLGWLLQQRRSAS